MRVLFVWRHPDYGLERESAGRADLRSPQQCPLVCISSSQDYLGRHVSLVDWRGLLVTGL